MSLTDVGVDSPSLDDVVTYYRHSNIAYKLFHSWSGALHLALNPKGAFDKSGYEEAPRRVMEHMPATARTSLELGCGKGYNLKVLSQLNNQGTFVGLDASERSIGFARNHLGRNGRVRLEVGDFGQTRFADGEFDFAFAIESLSHAKDPPRTLAELRRVVAPSSRVVVVDLWRTGRRVQSDSRDECALSLIERALALTRVMSHDDWVAAAVNAGFSVVDSVDLTALVMPNLTRFEKGATRVFNRRRIARLLVRCLPTWTVGNLVAGFLLAQSMREGLFGYHLLLLEAR